MRAMKEDSLEMPRLSEAFEEESGDVVMEISSIANITNVDLSLQDGKYIDERV